MTSKLFVRAVCVASLLAAATALGQPFDPSQRVLLSEGVLRGSPRVLGIAGAYVGVADDAEAITRNPAAAASKSPRFERDFNYDFGAALHFLPPWAVADQDWDNDGRLDQVDPLGGAFKFLGTQVIYLAATAQYKNVGIGLGGDLQNFIAAVPNGTINLGLVHLFGSLAVSVWDDQVLLGLGLESTQAVVAYLQSGLLFGRLGYFGWGVQLGALWRPKEQDYRVGFAFRPQGVGTPDTVTGGVNLGGLQPFSAIVAPARVSLGASFALGEGGRHYNIVDKSGWAASNLPADGGTNEPPGLTKWLITTQLDIFFPVRNATYVAAFLEQGTGLPAHPAGDRLSFEPRVGVEKELLANWVRLRAGGYLEPALVPTGSLRPHVTFGGEVRVFTLGRDWISFGLSFDFASRYQNLSVAFLVWK
jgi:hypothetical protein